MKLMIILCVIFNLHFNYANGRLSDLFDGIHNKVHEVREDIHNFVFPKDKSDSGQNVDVPSTSGSGNNFFFPKEKDSNTDASKPSYTAVNKDDKQVEATTQSATTQPATTQPATTQPTTTQPASMCTSTPSPTTTKVDTDPQAVTTTEKGRENFSGACLPGYLRTPDGRCKPTF